MQRRHLLKLLGGAALLPRLANAAEPILETRPLMGTTFKIRCYSDDRKLVSTAINEAFAIAENINQVASDYITDSELLSFSKLPYGTPHPVSATLLPLLIEAQYFAKNTQGAFDPTLGPLTRLWRISRKRKTLPEQDILEKAKAAAGYQKLELDQTNSTLTFKVPGMRLDLGGIAKGQTADAMLAVFKKHGLTQISITCGGDVRVGDPPPGRHAWNIQVKGSEESPAILQLVNAAVSTSGDLHQFIEIHGEKYSHILDPKTGLGLTNARSATIIAPTAAESDARATAACVLD